jgi:hypothetical protein
MIDRKGLWVLLLLCLAMIAAAVWRLSLLPDWTQMPMPTPKGLVAKSGFVLFIAPLALLFMIAVFAVQKWLIPGPGEALAVWYRRTWLLPAAGGAAMVLMQAFIISRSLGYRLGLDPQAVTRTMMVVTGILVILLGNVRPKLPRLSKRFAILDLDPWQSARNSRFAGRMSVAMGLAVVIAAVLLPLRAVTPAIFTFWLGFCGAIVWHFVRLKREPSPRP